MAKRPANEAVRGADKTATAGTPASQGSDRFPQHDDRAERRERISVAAYYKAERRNFQADGELDDWLEAEREVDSAGAAGGTQAEASRRAEGPSDVAAPAIKESADQSDDADYIAPTEVQRWARELGVSASTLRVAIERAGARVSDVKRYLEQHDQI